MSNARNLADLLAPGENTLQTVAIETDRIILNGTDGSATNAGDDLLLDASAASTDVGERFTYEDGTDDASVVLNNLNTLAVTNNVTIGGDIDVTGSGAGAAGISSASTSGTAISIDSSNRVVMASQPSFLAQPASIQSNVGVTDGTSVVIALGTERYDVGGNFSSNTFTAPVTGKYLLSATIYITSIDSAATYIQMVITTSNRFYFQLIDPDFGQDAAYWSFNHATVADMDENDTAVIKFAQYQGTIQADIQVETTFSGILIG